MDFNFYKIDEYLSHQSDQMIREYQEDLKMQAVVLMGLPAAGKSTFVNTQLEKYIPSAKSFSVTNSDAQVKALQYKTASDHFEALSKIKDADKFANFVGDLAYTKNDGSIAEHPVTFDWFQLNKKKGVKGFWKEFYKDYYASFFDIRANAKEWDKILFDLKVTGHGESDEVTGKDGKKYYQNSLLVLDTVAAKPNKVFKRLEKTRNQDYMNTIIYLEIEPELTIARDEYRGKTEGRSVGKDVIMGYDKIINQAYNEYVKNGKQPDGLVDRLIHFRWKQFGNSPVAGTYELVKDHRFSLERKKKGLSK